MRILWKKSQFFFFLTKLTYERRFLDENVWFLIFIVGLLNRTRFDIKRFFYLRFLCSKTFMDTNAFSYFQSYLHYRSNRHNEKMIISSYWRRRHLPCFSPRDFSIHISRTIFSYFKLRKKKMYHIFLILLKNCGKKKYIYL